MPSSKDLMSAPPVATGKGSISYLGVPEGYTAHRPDIQGPVGPKPGQDPRMKQPLYQEGSQYDPNGLAPELRATLQVKLDAAGLYDKGDTIRIGVWDDTTVAAYTKLLKFANQGGRTMEEALKELGMLTPAERAERGLGPTGKGGVGGASARDPLVVSLSNPQDLRAVVQRTARKTLGRGISEEEMTRFATAYQQLERQAQEQAYAVDPTGGTVVDPVSAEVFAEQQAEALDPVAAEAARQVDIFKTISAAMSGMRGE